MSGRASFDITWDDLRVPLERTGFVPGGNPPDFDVFRGNLRAYAFNPGTDEEVFFVVQLPHGWKEGSALRPHVHLGFPVAPVNGETFNFALEYSVQSPGAGVFAASTTINATHTIDTSEACEAQYGHCLLSLPEIDMTGHTVSAMLICRFYRDVSEGNHNQDVSVFEVDFHFRRDSLGTVLEFTEKP